MDPEIKRLLEETKALVKDNHEMLRAMRRNAWIGFIWQIVFWIIVIVGPIIYLAPYLGALPSADELQNVLNVYTTGEY